MDFIYDNSGKPYALKYDGTTYYYVLNLQGDVISIVTHWGESYGSYTYDAWGNVLSVSGDIANLNPIRYRGYYYDSETRLYYLQSRYYDPQVKRFVNADRYVSTGQGFIGHNMFAYCGNDAVNFMDPTGNCYYNSKGKWCHDNWEYIGNYQRKPEPATFLGKTPNGRNLYIGKNSNYSTTPNSIKAIDYRTNSDPNIQIYNSYKVTEPLDQIYVLHKLLEYNEETPTTPAWNRTFHSLQIEWIAHNDVFALRENEHCRHVDLNNADEGVRYFDFWGRAIKLQLQEWFH